MAEPEAFDDFILAVARDSWDVFRREALLFVIAAVVLMLLAVVSLGLIAGPLMIGFIELVRRSGRGEPLALGLLFSRFDTFVASLLALLVLAVGVSIGLCLLVIPGLIAALFSTYTLHAIAYEGAGAFGAIRRSVELARAHFLPTVSLVLLLSIAQTIGGAVLFGVLVTAPLSLIALTVGYERLQGAASGQVVAA